MTTEHHQPTKAWTACDDTALQLLGLTDKICFQYHIIYITKNGVRCQTMFYKSGTETKWKVTVPLALLYHMRSQAGALS